MKIYNYVFIGIYLVIKYFYISVGGE